MKTIQLSLTAVLLALLVGCASNPNAPVAKRSQPNPPDHAKTAVVHHPLSKAHGAGENALAVFGFKISRNDEDFVEAQRPQKMGLFVGSGGEVARLWFKPASGEETEVKVDSIKTFAGILGQKEWDSAILSEILKDLNK